MKVQICALALTETADVKNMARFDAHPFEGRAVCNRRNNQVAGILEADEATIKQMIDARSEQ